MTGFDDIAEAALFTPALTTLAAHPRARGRQAAQLVLQRIGSPELAAQQLTAAVALKNSRKQRLRARSSHVITSPSSPFAHSPTKASGR